MTHPEHSTNRTGARVLVVGPAWVGDMVMAQSLLKTLKARSAETAIDVLAPAWTRPLLDRMPEVDTAIDAPFTHGRFDLGARVRLARRLAANHYDRAIVLPNSWKSALVPFLARIPVRSGYVGEQRWGVINDLRKLDPQRLPTNVQRYVALALPADAPGGDWRSLPRPVLRVRPQDVDRALQELALPRPEAPVLGLCPGAEFGPAKRWPAEHFAEVARIHLTRGWSVWLFGSKHDTAAADVNALCDGRCTDLSGRTTLAQAIDLLSLTGLVVSNDTGLMHVAAALQRPVVAIYGSSDPGYTPPLSTRARIVSLELKCRPCFQRTCPLGHLDCLRRLSPAMVLAAAAALCEPGTPTTGADRCAY